MVGSGKRKSLKEKKKKGVAGLWECVAWARGWGEDRGLD